MMGLPLITHLEVNLGGKKTIVKDPHFHLMTFTISHQRNCVTCQIFSVQSMKHSWVKGNVVVAARILRAREMLSSLQFVPVFPIYG